MNDLPKRNKKNMKKMKKMKVKKLWWLARGLMLCGMDGSWYRRE